MTHSRRFTTLVAYQSNFKDEIVGSPKILRSICAQPAGMRSTAITVPTLGRVVSLASPSEVIECGDGGRGSGSDSSLWSQLCPVAASLGIANLRPRSPGQGFTVSVSAAPSSHMEPVSVASDVEGKRQLMDPKPIGWRPPPGTQRLPLFCLGTTTSDPKNTLELLSDTRSYPDWGVPDPPQIRTKRPIDDFMILKGKKKGGYPLFPSCSMGSPDRGKRESDTFDLLREVFFGEHRMIGSQRHIRRACMWGLGPAGGVGVIGRRRGLLVVHRGLPFGLGGEEVGLGGTQEQRAGSTATHTKAGGNHAMEGGCVLFWIRHQDTGRMFAMPLNSDKGRPNIKKRRSRGRWMGDRSKEEGVRARMPLTLPLLRSKGQGPPPSKLAAAINE
ncbi:hypothetical protein DL93DRAFT_2094672 [Clavulina sp. PMI_390]|nr:hypothetical protein DL93DRAFT_2094672 [Clavulina sp. PMI_390]